MMTPSWRAASLGVLTTAFVTFASIDPGAADPGRARLAQAEKRPAPATKPPPTAAEKAVRERELEALRNEQQSAAAATSRLKAEIEALGEDRRKLNEALIQTAARIRAVEDRMTAGENAIAELEAEQKRIRQSLQGRRARIAEILAALQRMGHRPPPAVLMRPDDALESVRTAMLLGAVLPEMRKDTEVLLADLDKLVRLRNAAEGERTILTHDLVSLAQERTRMALLETERQRKLSETQRAFDAEKTRAAALARQADDLKDLIAKFEKDIAAASRAAAAAARAEPPAATETRQALAALRDPGRLSPAIAFASAKGALPLPVSGIRLREFGAADGLGGTERGQSIAARTGAQVTAPCDGWVVYAGPFRSYGQLLILNAGGGYHVLLAGMERISVELGQFVLTGEPVAVMGSGPQTAAAVASGSRQPILYVEFRKDGAPVDPDPWWMTTGNEKVRG